MTRRVFTAHAHSIYFFDIKLCVTSIFFIFPRALGCERLATLPSVFVTSSCFFMAGKEFRSVRLFCGGKGVSQR